MKDRLRAIFNKYDLMGLDGPLDEYDTEIDLLLKRKASIIDLESLKKSLKSIFIETFDNELFEDVCDSEFELFADEIGNLLLVK